MRTIHLNIRFILITLFVYGVFSSMFAQEAKETYNQQDEQGRKQGYWRKTNEEGKLVYEGQFLNNQPFGEFRYFYPSGRLRVKMLFSDSGDTAKTIHYHQHQIVQSEGIYIDQKKDGPWKFYNEAGILVSEENYTHDLKDGQVRSFYANGILLEEQHFSMGVQVGSWKQYHPNGNLKHEIKFENGLMHGIASYYFPDGGLYLSGNYHQGLKNGEWVRFSAEGEIESTEIWTMGIYENIQIE